VPQWISLAIPSSAQKTEQTTLSLTDEKPNVKHHLSKEHQMYFETITKYLLSNEPNLIQKAMLSLRIDAGIQQLLPYFIQFVSEMVHCVCSMHEKCFYRSCF
jgi:hypothetical protein